MTPIKKMCCEFYGIFHIDDDFIKTYPGFNIEEEMSEFIKKFKINVIVYKATNNQYNEYREDDRFVYDSKADTMKLLLLYLPSPHFTLIKDLDTLTHRKWCPKCNEFYAVMDKHCNAVRDLERHLENCKGMQKKKLRLATKSLLYCTHITRNPILQYLVAYGHTNIFGSKLHENSIAFTLTLGYITYDFETMDEIVESPENPQTTTILAKLKPLSVAMTVSTSITKSFYFDIREENFLDKFIEKLWEQAKVIAEYNIQNNALYQYLHRTNTCEDLIKKMYQRFH